MLRQFNVIIRKKQDKKSRERRILLFVLGIINIKGLIKRRKKLLFKKKSLAREFLS